VENEIDTDFACGYSRAREYPASIGVTKTPGASDGESGLRPGESRPQRFAVWNGSRGSIVAENVELADTPRARRVGLLKHAELRPDEGMWIYPSQAIHTFWMRFPIDVVFLDRRRRVKRVYQRLPPFRLTRFVWGAASVLELAPGTVARGRIEVGDELLFTPLET